MSRAESIQWAILAIAALVCIAVIRLYPDGFGDVSPETPVDSTSGGRVEWRAVPAEYMRVVVGGVVRMTIDDQMRVTCHGVGGRSVAVVDGKAVCHVK